MKEEFVMYIKLLSSQSTIVIGLYAVELKINMFRQRVLLICDVERRLLGYNKLGVFIINLGRNTNLK